MKRRLQEEEERRVSLPSLPKKKKKGRKVESHGLKIIDEVHKIMNLLDLWEIFLGFFGVGRPLMLGWRVSKGWRVET